jgi:hypothetical protein
MLGMMNKGGGSTPMPATGMPPAAPMPQMGAQGGIPGKGGATMNAPVGNPAPAAGMPPGPDLRSLFANNKPVAPGGGGGATLPVITAPKRPVIDMPPVRKPDLPPEAAPAPVPIPKFQSPMQLSMWMDKNPGKLSDQQVNAIKRGWSRPHGTG